MMESGTAHITADLSSENANLHLIHVKVELYSELFLLQ